jgi:hypothetical protein
MRDRADVFAGRCWHVFADAILAWLHGEPLNAASIIARVAAAARDEFADIQRQAASETRL